MLVAGNLGQSRFPTSGDVALVPQVSQNTAENHQPRSLSFSFGQSCEFLPQKRNTVAEVKILPDDLTIWKAKAEQPLNDMSVECQCVACQPAQAKKTMFILRGEIGNGRSLDR